MFENMFFNINLTPANAIGMTHDKIMFESRETGAT